MTPTTSGAYRVLSDPRRGSELLLVETETYEPTTVALDEETASVEDDGFAAQVAALRPGYAIEATLAWADGVARFESLSVTTRTLLSFADGVSGLFEAALDTMEEARRDGLGVHSTVTYSTDGRSNGALYAFAEQAGERDVFAEFRNGTRPLEPLLERAAAEVAEPYEVFVFRPATHRFVLVYIVLRKESVLADTVRDTYDCPRPEESPDKTA